MSFVLMLLATQGSAAETTPQMQSVVVSRLNDGVCTDLGVSQSASIQVVWSASSFDAALYVYKLYENDVLVATQDTTTYVKTISGKKENGLNARFTSDWVFRVDVCQEDGAVVSSLASAMWAKIYGGCAALPEPT